MNQDKYFILGRLMGLPLLHDPWSFSAPRIIIPAALD